MKQNRRSQHGFALLLTLVLLMIAVITLAQIARQSSSEALHALDASEELQRRWAVVSCRSTLLPRASRLLVDTVQQPLNDQPAARRATTLKPPGTDLRIACELAGMTYELVLTDEQAKYNPTAMGLMQIDSKPLVPPHAMENIVYELSGARDDSNRLGDGQVMLRPTIDPDENDEPTKVTQPGTSAARAPAVYTGYGQLFEVVTPAQFVGTAERPGVVANLTCWGDGRINIHRAPKAAIKRALMPVLGAQAVTAFLIARDESPGLTPQDWLNTLKQVPPDRRAIAASMLVERSQTQGLWVVAHGRTRAWYTFSVREYIPKQEQQQQVNAQVLQDETDPEDAEQSPDPLQRYDFAW